MSFLERLRSYLERVERAPDGLPHVRVDLAAHHRHFITERDRRGTLKADPAAERMVAFLTAEHVALSRQLPTFVDEVAERIEETLAPEAPPEEITRLVNHAITLELGLPGASGSPSRDEELKRIADEVRSRMAWDVAQDGWRSPARYAFEIRATRRRGDRFILTRGGATFLELPGIDAVRWLLALEAAQSLGPTDDWRLSAELAAHLLKEPERHFDHDDLISGGALPWHGSFATIRRLDAMKLLDYHGQDGFYDNWGYTLFDRARPILEEIAEQRPTPFAVLADALLRDEVAYAIDRVHPDPERAVRESAAAANVLQARMVVHEIRNALIPAQVALSKLVRDVGDTARAEPLQKHRGRVDAGIQRALAFADEMLKVASLGTEAPVLFDVAAAIRDATAGIEGELNGNLRYAPPEGVPQVVGPRTRFVLAIISLLRNAVQSVTGTEGVVEVSVEVQDGSIVVRVDDNGEGVPEAQRHAIFEPGFALRPGGSGQGLTLVRQVIEGEMLGAVTCAQSPLGGANFEIVLPAKEARWKK